MQSPIHLTIVMEAAEVERLTNLNTQGVLLYVRYREQQLQGTIASHELSEQKLYMLSKKNVALKVAVSPSMNARVAMYFWRRKYNSHLQ